MSAVNYKAPRTISNFMLDDHEVRLILGPFGSGKTTGCVMELARRMLQEYPDAKGVRKTRFVIVRNTAQQLRQTVLEDIRKWLEPVMSYKVTDSTLQFRFNHPQFGRIESDWMLIPLDKPEDQQRLLSLNITGGWVSEFREVPIGIVEAMLGRVGRYRPLGVEKNAWYGIIGESNPPDEDSEWYTRLELERPSNWAVFKQPGGMEPDAENLENLREGYYESLIESNNPDWVDIHVHAKYGKSLSGTAVFRRTFNPDFHIAEKPLRAIPGLRLMIGQDFGRTPAALIGQVDNRGRLLIFKELISEGMGIQQFTTENTRPFLLEHFPGYSNFIIADPTGKDKAQTREESPFDVLKSLGFAVYPAPSNRLDPRLRAVEQLFLRQVDGGPAVLIDPEGCPMLIRALKFYYRFKKKRNGNFEDEPEKLHPWSDLADCLQYMAMAMIGDYIAKKIERARPERRPPPRVAGWT